MRLAIVGSRDFHNYDVLETEVINFICSLSEDIVEIISGGAQGADTLAYRFAKENSIPIRVIFPNWTKHGKTAGMIRNLDIIKNCDYVMAFWDYKSRGTAHSIKVARDLNIPVKIIGVY